MTTPIPTRAAAVEDILLVPRWSGTAHSDYYPWLIRKLNEQFPKISVRVCPLLPEPGRPEVERCLTAVSEANPGSGTLLIGHSVGCQVLMRYLAALPDGVGCAGLLCVAGWWTVDSPWSPLRPWLDTPFEVSRVGEHCLSMDVLLSDNDPFTRDTAASQQRFAQDLGATVQICPGRGHFNAEEEPDVLRSVQRRLGSSARR